jgi:carbonic anhydrase
MVYADEAIKRLMEGNSRFVNSSMHHPRCDPTRRQSVSKVQEPSAAILCCSDSRVPPELIFDQGLGDLFVVRCAGNVAEDIVLGSLEYAVTHLHVPLIIVLGHTSCGAISAAMDCSHEPRGRIDIITSKIQEAALLTENRCDNADGIARKHAERTAEFVRSSEPILKKKCADGEVYVAAALYNMQSGVIEIIS